jgi:choline kinase
MKAIILSAGRGTRFENSGKTNHKSLLKVGGSTIIERQLKILKELGVDEIMVVIGHESTILKNNLEAYHLSFTYNEFYKETDTLYSLWCAKDFINDDFLCLYADLVFEKEIVLNLINNNYEISLLIDNQKNHADSHSVFVVDKFVKSVRSKSEKCNSQFVGIVKFSKNGSIALNKILDNFHKQNNLDGEIIRIFEKLIDDSFPLHACFTNNQKWFNVNDISQLESSRDFFGP